MEREAKRPFCIDIHVEIHVSIQKSSERNGEFK